MVGEICAVRQDSNQGERKSRRSCSCSTFTIRSGKGVPEKALSISGADRFGRRGGYLPTTRDIYEPTVSYLGVAGGIVKHGGMFVRQRRLFNQLACLTGSTAKLADCCRASAALSGLALCTATPCALQLGALAGIIDKAAAHCAANKIEESALLQDRLYPDMFCLARQIRQSADFGMNTGAA